MKRSLTCLSLTSVLHHSLKHKHKHKPFDLDNARKVIHSADELLAHAVLVYAVALGLAAQRKRPFPTRVNLGLGAATAWIVWVYRISRWTFINGYVGDACHASLHVVAVGALAALTRYT